MRDVDWDAAESAAFDESALACSANCKSSQRFRPSIRASRRRRHHRPLARDSVLSTLKKRSKHKPGPVGTAGVAGTPGARRRWRGVSRVRQQAATRGCPQTGTALRPHAERSSCALPQRGAIAGQDSARQTVVTVIGVDVIDGKPGIWMELIAGATLQDLVQHYRNRRCPRKRRSSAREAMLRAVGCHSSGRNPAS